MTKDAKVTTLLSKREQDVMRLIPQGKSNKEIAKELSMSTRTVKGHVEWIMRKLCAANRAQVAAYAVLNYGCTP